jgi:GNAT superfamily N-acetyltransferase
VRDDGYTVSSDRGRIDRAAIHAFLSEEAYWALGRSREVIDASIDASACVGAYAPDGAQAAFARVVSDGATFAWLCDVFVLPAHRGRGLGVRVVEAALALPGLAAVPRWWLGTNDAHGLYERFGFERHPEPHKVMLRTATR